MTFIHPDEIVALGASLRRIDPKILTPENDQQGMRVWYQGGEPYFDLFIEMREDRIEWFQFTLRGKSICWSAKESKWHTGSTNEMEVDDVSFYPASKIVESDRYFDHDLVELVHKIISTRAGEPIFDRILLLFANGSPKK
ncbi:MAG: hypothetical protein SAJ37_17435 [Oscillatoria sp. PMC 1068.18]|nr:hypothetical protein [Oscillatoria sp. PMC 1076.18]MEC4990516.1 hypothetical protein [Oscillatoria sp. PMC 1068.18]